MLPLKTFPSNSMEEVQVEFLFDPFCDGDELETTRLLAQNFESLELSSLVEFIVQESIGTKITVDDNLYGMNALVWNSPKSELLFEYLLKCAKSPESQKFKEMLETSAIIVNERLINMPDQVAPSLFKLLEKDIADAQEAGKVYREVESSADAQEDDSDSEKEKENEEAQDPDAAQEPKPKRRKPLDTVQYYQAEDEYFADAADLVIDYKSKKPQNPDARRVFSEFGIEQSRRLIVLQSSRLPKVIERIEKEIV